MANEDNLKPPRSKSEARARGAKGGKKSGEARRRKRALKELMLIYGEMKDPDNAALTNDEALVVSQYRLAKSGKLGSTQAATFIRDTRGEKPHDVLETPDIQMKPLLDLTIGEEDGEDNSA